MAGHIQLVYYVASPAVHLIHNNHDGTPINLSHGAVPTEARGVFIHDVSYSATSADIRNLMQQAGRVVRCEVNTHTGTTRSRGSATVAFSTAAEARRAVEIFNGAVFAGRTIRVRFDTEFVSLDSIRAETEVAESSTSSATVQTEHGPIIVDGSGGCPLPTV